MADDRDDALNPLLLDGLIEDSAALVLDDRADDAALAAALSRHLDATSGENGDAVGPLAVAAGQVDALRPLADPGGLLRVALVADDGLLALQEARHAVQDDAWIELTHVEIDLPAGFSPGESTRALLAELSFTVPTYVGLPRTGFDTGLDALAEDGAEHAAYRSAGPDGFPTDGELAAFIHGCVSRGVGFRLTGGPSHAVRSDGSDPHHGVLNVLAAVAASVDGAATGDLAELLASGLSAPLLEVVASVPPRTLRSAFHGFASADPSATLRRLGAEHALPTS